MTKTLVNCLVLADADAPCGGPVDVVIRDGRIAAVRPTGEAPPEGAAIDLTGRLVTAGAINGHHHSHENFYKGRYDNLPLELWMNYVRPPEPLPLTKRHVYLRTMIGAIEAIRSGTTTLIDDLNVSPVLRPEHVAAVFQAYEDIGIRALVGISLFDRPFYRAVPFVDEEFPPDLLRELDARKGTPPDELLAFARDLAAKRHPRTSRVASIVAPSAPQRCTDEFLARVRRLADDLDLPAMIHVHETRLQAVTAQLSYGCTMIEHLRRLGFLKPRTTLIHAVWLTPRDIEILAAHGVSVQHNPTSNLKLGSGMAPIRALRDAEVNISLGTDGCGSTETLNMLKAVNLTALIHKLRGEEPDRWIGARDAWEAATGGGACAIGMEDEIGAVRHGRRADLAVYRLDRFPFVPLNDALRQLVFCETGAGLEMVLVDGAAIMKDGRLTRIDEEGVLQEIAEAHRHLEPLIADSERRIAPLREAYARIYRRCQACAIPNDTYVARLHE